jgi:hypothetical protein
VTGRSSEKPSGPWVSFARCLRGPTEMRSARLPDAGSVKATSVSGDFEVRLLELGPSLGFLDDDGSPHSPRTVRRGMSWRGPASHRDVAVSGAILAFERRHGELPKGFRIDVKAISQGSPEG